MGHKAAWINPVRLPDVSMPAAIGQLIFPIFTSTALLGTFSKCLFVVQSILSYLDTLSVKPHILKVVVVILTDNLHLNCELKPNSVVWIKMYRLGTAIEAGGSQMFLIIN